MLAQEEEQSEPIDRKQLLAEALGGVEEEGFDLSEDDDEEDYEVSPSDSDEVKNNEQRKVSSPETKSQTKPQEAEPLVVAPEGMSAEEQAEFEKLPAKTKHWVSKRYADFRRDYTQKTMELSRERNQIAQERGRYQYMQDLQQKHADRLARKKTGFADALNNALAWDHFIDEHGAAGLLQYVEAHGFDPEELIEARNGEAPRARNQEQTAAVPKEIQEKLSRFEQYFAQLSQAQQAQYFERTTSAFEKFKAETPLFRDPGTADRLERVMAPHVANLRARDPMGDPATWLQRAYAYALSDDPALAALVNGAQKLQKIEREQDRTRRALASSSATGGPGSGSLTRVPKDRRELIGAALEGRITL